MSLAKCACIDTLYTELPWLERFQAAKNDGFEAGTGVSGILRKHGKQPKRPEL